jgi:hypothetical protein
MTESADERIRESVEAVCRSESRRTLALLIQIAAKIPSAPFESIEVRAVWEISRR